MSVDGIEEAFVTPFPHSSTRKDVMEGYRKHTSELKGIIDEYSQLIDGSFESNKNDPGDIDFVCFMDGDKVDALSSTEKDKLQKLFSGPLTKSTHLCDAYFCPSFPDTHPNFEFYRSKRKYWMGEFGFDRLDVPKGIVLVDEKPSPPPSSATLA